MWRHIVRSPAHVLFANLNMCLAAATICLAAASSRTGPLAAHPPPSLARATFPEHLVGNVSAVETLLERVLPGSSSHFELSLALACPGIPSGRACFTIADGGGGSAARTVITGTSASELTGGLGIYLREYCGMTFGWERGGSSRVFTPASWPRVGSPVSRARSVPYSHVTQVCTHSYTLVWHGWAEWERFIDWMALAGHNSIVAPTGQEEIQYKIFTEQFGLVDSEVRNWTNGPAFLTWSRGQNSHGNSIAGPLPRSFMKGQWALARQILSRYRELGIAGHQPAFAGYAPWALAVRQNDTKKNDEHPYPCTRGSQGARGNQGAVDTAWVDGRDALFTRIADAWMEQIIADFGSDHVWQMDGFFAGGTGWGEVEKATEEGPNMISSSPHGRSSSSRRGGRGDCIWSPPSNDTYLKGCARHAGTPVSGTAAATVASTAGAQHKSVSVGPCTPGFASLSQAQAACVSDDWPDCAGITWQFNVYQLRAGSEFIRNPPTQSHPSTSYRITNWAQCKHGQPPPDPVPSIDPVWLARAKGAYGAVARADGPLARWILQGWMLLIKNTGFGPAKGPMRGALALSRLKAYAAAAPPGNFIVTDMDRTGAGQWEKWNGDWGLPFLWTSLHVFGGDQASGPHKNEIRACMKRSFLCFFDSLL